MAWVLQGGTNQGIVCCRKDGVGTGIKEMEVVVMLPYLVKLMMVAHIAVAERERESKEGDISA